MLSDNLLELVREQIGWQLDAYNSLEVKAIGLLAFDAALAAVMASFAHGREPYHVLFFAFLGISAVASVISLWVRKVYVGPEVARFYVETSGLTDGESQAQLLADLSAAAKANHRPIARKGLYWNVGAALLLLALVAGSLSV